MPFVDNTKEILKEPENMFQKDELSKKVLGEMQKIVLIDSEFIIQKVLSRLVQSD